MRALCPQLAALNASKHMPIYCMERMASCIREALRQGQLDTIQAAMLDANITGFNDYIGASERLLKTPVPFGLVLHLRWVMIFYILTVPLYLAGPGGLLWGSIPVTVIFAYSLTGLEDISQSIENPFRQNWHCLPIGEHARTVAQTHTAVPPVRRAPIPPPSGPMSNPPSGSSLWLLPCSQMVSAPRSAPTCSRSRAGTSSQPSWLRRLLRSLRSEKPCGG